MQPFETRFYARTSGYQEYKLDDSGGLFPEDMAYHFWEEDALFPSGTYAIHYSSSAYILSCLTEVSPALDWRDNRIRIALALDCRHRLLHPLETFDSLLYHFQELARIYPDLSLLRGQAAVLNHVVAMDLLSSPEQSLSGRSSSEKAVTAYGHREELVALLVHPFRPEFEQVSALYILSQQEAVRLWPMLKGKFKAITGVKYEEVSPVYSDHTDDHVETFPEPEPEVKPETEPEEIEKKEKDEKPSLKKENRQLKVTFRIENERLRQKLAAGVTKVWLEWKWLDADAFEEKKTLTGVDITQPSYAIPLPVDRMYTFTLQAKGYRKCVIQRDYICADKPKEGDEDVIPVTFQKPLYKKFVLLESVLVVGLLLGFVMGVAVGKKQLNKSIVEQEAVSVEIYEKIKDDHDELRNKPERLKQAEKSSDNVFSPKEIILKDSSSFVIPLLSEMDVDSLKNRKALLRKLQGTSFTQKDIQVFKKMKPDGREKRLIRSCEACLKLLNMSVKDKRRARDEIMNAESGFMYHLYREASELAHRRAMRDIIEGRYAPVYMLDGMRNFESIDDAIEHYEEMLEI